jgi:hypothetical protein
MWNLKFLQWRLEYCRFLGLYILEHNTSGLKLDAAGSSEASLTIYRVTWHDIPEESNRQKFKKFVTFPNFKTIFIF